MTITTGIDNNVVALAVGTNADTESGVIVNDDCGVSVGETDVVLQYPSWSVVKKEGKYEILNPIVIGPSGAEITPTIPASISNGDWVCKITKTGEAYTAEVVNTAAPAPTAETEGEEEETPVVVAQVPICTVSGDGVIQKHVGAIVCVGGGREGHGQSEVSAELVLYKELGYDNNRHVFWGKPVRLTIENGIVTKLEGYAEEEEIEEIIFTAVEETAY